MAIPENTQNKQIYTNFDLENDIVSDVATRVTYGLWSNNVGTLTTFFTSSTQPVTATGVGKYYHDVYSTATSASAQVEFSIAYGHVADSGSLLGDRDKPAQAIYDQYRNLLLSTKNAKFTLGTGGTLDHALFISINRSNLKQKLDGGNWQLNLVSGSTTTTLVDDSGDSSDSDPTLVGDVLNIVSGTIGGTTGSTNYGLCYTKYGILVLDPDTIPVTINTGSDGYKDNSGKLYDSIKSGASFQARSEEKISSTHYFCRVKNKQYNYSDNITFYSGSNGALIYPSFNNDPHTFITTIGLYNNNNDLLAIGKLTKPVEKTFGNEALFKIKLDF